MSKTETAFRTVNPLPVCQYWGLRIEPPADQLLHDYCEAFKDESGQQSLRTVRHFFGCRQIRLHRDSETELGFIPWKHVPWVERLRRRKEARKNNEQMQMNRAIMSQYIDAPSMASTWLGSLIAV